MVERTQTEFLNAQADLVEKARDASQLAAKRAQDAETRTRGVETQTKVLRDQAEDVLSQVAERQSQIEATIGANVPEHEWSGTQLRLRNPDGEWGAFTDLVGEEGDAGWSPVLAAEVDGERRVLRVVDWVGGEGAKPAAEGYVGSSGLVATAAEAVDVRGGVGPPGADGADGADGTNGTDGADGDDGADGASAYEIAVANGFVGTEVDWLASLIGDQGPPGESGGASSADVIRLAIQVAELRGSIAGLANGIADSFEDASGVDAAASSNEDAQSGAYRPSVVPPTVESSQSLPAMTANNAPSGHVASFGSGANPANVEPYRAFDQVDSRALSTNTSDTLVRQLPSAIKVGAYRITTSTNSGENNRAPVTWTFQGSNDGTTWTTLDTRSGVTWAAGANVQQTFTIPEANRGSYTRYRLNYTAVNGGTAFTINELSFLQETAVASYAAMDLRSIAFTALAAPAKASLTVATSRAIAPNTDLNGYVSRDGGTTWTQATLTVRETLSDGSVIYEDLSIDISAQPSGTSMKWRVATTAQATVVDVRAVALLLE